MPYSNVPEELQDKMESCVQKVMDGGAEKESAVAICYTSVVEGKSLHDAYKSFFLDADAIKAGRMISAKNKTALRQAMEIIAALVADEAEEENEPEEMSEPEPMKSADDVLVSYGSAVKSVQGKPGGYAVRFGGQDLTGDTFSRDTNFGFAGESTRKVDILFHHAQPIETKTGRKIQVTDPIGQATLKLADDGVMIEDAIIFNADKYAKHLDKLGWSTGAAAHSVVRDGGTIKQWQIAEVSLTPIPAEPRNMVAAKSLAGEVVDMDDEALPDFREIGRQVGAEIALHIKHLQGQHDQADHAGGGGGGGDTEKVSDRSGKYSVSKKVIDNVKEKVKKWPYQSPPNASDILKMIKDDGYSQKEAVEIYTVLRDN